MVKSLLDTKTRAHVLNNLNERHSGGLLGGETFTVEARKLGDNVVATLVLAARDRTAVYTMEAAIVRERYSGMSVDDARDICLDFLDWYVGTYLQARREPLLPLDWQPHRFGDVEIMARGDLRNEFLDAAADAWLRGERPDVETEWRRRRRGQQQG